jgi:hypothetical protein
MKPIGVLIIAEREYDVVAESKNGDYLTAQNDLRCHVVRKSDLMVMGSCGLFAKFKYERCAELVCKHGSIEQSFNLIHEGHFTSQLYLNLATEEQYEAVCQQVYRFWRGSTFCLNT